MCVFGVCVQSEAEQECSSSVMRFGNRRNSNLEVGSDSENKKGLVRTRSGSSSCSDMVDQLKGLRTWSSQHSAVEVEQNPPHHTALDLVLY